MRTQISVCKSPFPSFIHFYINSLITLTHSACFSWLCQVCHEPVSPQFMSSLSWSLSWWWPINFYKIQSSTHVIVAIIIIIISTTMFMVLSSWQSHCESSPGSFDECRMVPSGRRPKTKPDDLGYESACTGCQSLHPPSPFIIITQTERWYSFYHPMEGRRLSWPSWLVTYRDGLPALRRSPIPALTGSDVAQLSQTTNHVISK